MVLLMRHQSSHCVLSSAVFPRLPATSSHTHSLSAVQQLLLRQVGRQVKIRKRPREDWSGDRLNPRAVVVSSGTLRNVQTNWMTEFKSTSPLNVKLGTSFTSRDSYTVVRFNKSCSLYFCIKTVKEIWRFLHQQQRNRVFTIGVSKITLLLPLRIIIVSCM